MKYTPRQYASALNSLVTEKTDENMNSKIKKFAAFLKKNNALHLYREIAEKFGEINRETNGKKEITIRAANSETAKKLKTKFGSESEPKIVIDETLIAGSSIVIDDLRIDNSIKSRLSQMKKALAH
jgi:F0F1-type ATP synthase delta subunit